VDIDSIRVLVAEERYVVSHEFHRRADQRGFSLTLAILAIETGSIVEERPDQTPFPKCTVAATVPRNLAGVTIGDELHVALAVGDFVVFMTGYWKRDRPRRGQTRAL
jgi:hypothetical protein